MTTASNEDIARIMNEVLDRRPRQCQAIIKQQIDDELSPITETLYGNGKDGITTRMALLESEMSSAIVKLDQIEEGVREIQGTLLRPQVKSAEEQSQKTMRVALLVVAAVAALFVAGYGANRIGVKLPADVGIEQADGHTSGD